MDAELANAISEGYERWAAAGDQSVQDLFSPDFYDNVSGQTGLAIFDVVGRWLAGAIMSSAVVFHARWFCPTFREAEAAASRATNPVSWAWRSRERGC